MNLDDDDGVGRSTAYWYACQKYVTARNDMEALVMPRPGVWVILPLLSIPAVILFSGEMAGAIIATSFFAWLYFYERYTKEMQHYARRHSLLIRRLTELGREMAENEP